MAEPGITCDTKDVDVAINNAVEEKDDTYQDLMTRLTAKQKALLLALAHAGKDKTLLSDFDKFIEEIK